MHFFIQYLKKNRKKSIFILLFGIVFYFSLPKHLFDDPYSTVVISRDNILLSAQVAKDGQWRFPPSKSVGAKFEHCITLFEDEYFRKHFGFNPISILKATYQNIQAKKIVRGGSTITQQVVRLSRKNRKRTFFEKIIELYFSIRVECTFSKDEILNLYLSHAPFGGNVVGLEAASWRYFNTKSENLSWAQAATLAVLPNAPSLIFPGKNQNKLKKKRNKLLKKLFDKSIIDKTTFQLACLEPLPQKPYLLNQYAFQFKNYIEKKGFKGKLIQSTLDFNIQNNAEKILNKHYHQNKKNGVFNGAILIVDNETKDVLAYIGNTNTTKENQVFVDNIQSQRSSGSILKPFLYASLYDEGIILPQQLLKDIPTQIGNYTPKNFDNDYYGLVSAQDALSKSLNIPAVRQLQYFGISKFYKTLKDLKFSTLSKKPEHYGLSLILGGAEVKLWDLVRAYSYLSSGLEYFNSSYNYRSKECSKLNYIKNHKVDFGYEEKSSNIFKAGSIYHVLEDLQNVKRPIGEKSWDFYSNAEKISWKTGTSFGFRDAWALGTNGRYTVGVWVGNSDGEGRPELIGTKTAAPILFDVFNFLKNGKELYLVDTEKNEISVCTTSGYLPQESCAKKKIRVAINSQKIRQCPYHKTYFLDSNKENRVNSTCYPVYKMKKEHFFELPPLVSYYYQRKNKHIKPIPPYLDFCKKEKERVMEIIYPYKQVKKLYRTKNYYGKYSDLIFQVAYKGENAILYWYIDNNLIQTTDFEHRVLLAPKIGKHRLKIVDNKGNEIEKEFEVLGYE